jgi:WhiB family redox-sensing transcriptional regulator
VRLTSDHPFSWLSVAECGPADTELFFSATEEQTAPAREICGRCLARVQCLSYALAHEELTGIWGGTSDEERNLLCRAAT